MAGTTIDVNDLNLIPEARRASATKYTQPDLLWTEFDEECGVIPTGKKVGDLKEAGHDRWQVTFDEEAENAAKNAELEARIAALESS